MHKRAYTHAYTRTRDRAQAISHLLGGGGEACANSPDGLVGKDHLRPVSDLWVGGYGVGVCVCVCVCVCMHVGVSGSMQALEVNAPTHTHMRIENRRDRHSS